MTTFQVHHPRKGDPPAGMCVEPFGPATRLDPGADERQAVSTILPLLVDRSYSIFRLCDVTGLSIARLRRILESELMARALDDVEACLRVRERAVDMHKKFVADAALLNLAATVPMDSREAEPVRKAANQIRKPPPKPGAKDQQSQPLPHDEPRPNDKPRPSGSGPLTPAPPHTPTPLPITPTTTLHAACGSCRPANPPPAARPDTGSTSARGASPAQQPRHHPTPPAPQSERGSAGDTPPHARPKTHHNPPPTRKAAGGSKKAPS